MLVLNNKMCYNISVKKKQGEETMSSIIKDKNSKWLVRSGNNEWIFETYDEAQKKANEEMLNEAKKKGLL